VSRQPADLTYSATCGLFTSFYAETEAGAAAWAQIAAQTDGTGKVLHGHVAGTLAQLRAAGLVVRKAGPSAVSDDELMAELG
jgi:hypothetical protein